MRKLPNILQKLKETKYIFVQLHANTNQTKILQNMDGYYVNQHNQKNILSISDLPSYLLFIDSILPLYFSL